MDNKNHDQPPILTARALLDLCSLATVKTDVEVLQEVRQQRFRTLEFWHEEQSDLLSKFLLTSEGVDKKTGCFPLHWSAGTGFNEAIVFILDHYGSTYSQETKHLMVNQLAEKPSTGRTPLHYAARNGHLRACQILIESYNADPNPKCHKGSVTPIQLAVWQNQLPIVEYLVSANGKSVVLERNDFNCGLNHWIGLIAKHRWLSSDGSGVLPLAKFLHDCGVSYNSSAENQQNQGHTPLHKAAWGGNIALMEYFRNEHNAHDTIQDSAGNYAADLAGMAGNTQAQEWLYRHGSLDREKSCTVLGLDAAATTEEIQARFKQLARKYHPDKQIKNGINTAQRNGEDVDFMKIKAAYEHLIHQGGVGTQANPKYEALKLLTASAEIKKQKNSTATHGELSDNDDGGDDDLFQARILAILSDYPEDKGFPTSLIPKRWNQIWPDRTFPSPENYIIKVPVVVPSQNNHGSDLQTTMVPKRVKLLRFLKWKCRGVVTFRKVDGVELAFQKKKDVPQGSGKDPE